MAMNSLVTYDTTEYTKADYLRWVREALNRQQEHLRDLVKLSVPISLKEIGVYHKYWQDYHCSWNYDDYEEDYPFEKFLELLEGNYISKTKKELEKKIKEEKERIEEIKKGGK